MTDATTWITLEGWTGEDAEPITEFRRIDGMSADVFVVMGDRARFAGGTGPLQSDSLIRMIITGNPFVNSVEHKQANVRLAISDFRVWTIDKAHLDAAAQSEYVFPKEDAAEVTVPGLTPDVGEIDVTREDDVTVLGLQVDTITRRYHHKDGVTTTYTVGPRVDPATLEAMSLVKERDRRVLVSARRGAERRPA